MTDLTDVQREILAGCSGDFEDLSSIVNFMTKAGTILRHLTLEELQERVLENLNPLLEAKLIQAGNFDSTGLHLKPWALCTDGIIDRIRKEWNEHLREGVPWPDPWEIVCFVSTVEGDRALSEGKKRNVHTEEG